MVLMGILCFTANNVDDYTQTIVKKLIILAYFVLKRYHILWFDEGRHLGPVVRWPISA